MTVHRGFRGAAMAMALAMSSVLASRAESTHPALRAAATPTTISASSTPTETALTPTATATATATRTRSVTASTHSDHDCLGDTAYSSGLGFSLSLARATGGSATPQQAAATFARHGGVPGFDRPPATWVTVPSADGVDLRSPRQWLHVARLRDHTWAVTGGRRCG